MNKGWLRAQGRRSRQRPLVYIRTQRNAHETTSMAQAIPDGTTKTADFNIGITDDIRGKAGIPIDGSVKRVRVLVIAQSSAVGSNAIYVHGFSPYTQYLASGVNPSTLEWGGMYFGKVAGHYDTAVYDVTTNDKGQFYWSLNWASGTATCYLRVIGYWVEAD